MHPILFRSLIFDEQVYFFYSWLLRSGYEFYNEFWFDDKGPTIYLLYLIPSVFSNNVNNIVAIKVFTIVYQLITVFIFFKITELVFSNYRRVKYYVAFVFVILYTSSLFEGVYSNADNFILLPILLAVYMFFHRRYYWAAFLIGISFTIKQNTALQLIPILLSTFYKESVSAVDSVFEKISKVSRILFMQILLFFSPILLYALYFLSLSGDTFDRFAHLVFLDRITSHITNFNYNYFVRYFFSIFNQTAVLWLSALAFLVTFIFIFLTCSINASFFRRFNKVHVIYVFIWVLVSIVSVSAGGNFFPHYFIELLPTLIVGSFIVFLNFNILFLGFFFLFTFVLCHVPLLTRLRDPLYLSLILASASIYISMCLNKKLSIKADLRAILLVGLLFTTYKYEDILDRFRIFNEGQKVYLNRSTEEKNMFSAITFIKSLSSDRIFVYDYGPMFYIYSDIIPITNYGFKYLYVNYYKALNQQIYSSILGYETKQDILKESVSSGGIDYIVINAYSIVNNNEIGQLDFLNEMLFSYIPLKVFDKVWVYKYINGRDTTVAKNNTYRIKNTSIIDDMFFIDVVRNLETPDVFIDMICGDKTWTYPENGIDYPFKAEQSLDNIYLKGVLRGQEGKSCMLSVINMNGVTYDIPLVLEEF